MSPRLSLICCGVIILLATLLTISVIQNWCQQQLIEAHEKAFAELRREIQDLADKTSHESVVTP